MPFHFFWLVVTLLFSAVVVAIVLFAIRALPAPRDSSDGALEVLRRRLAAGEITTEEFEKTKKALEA